MDWLRHLKPVGGREAHGAVRDTPTQTAVCSLSCPSFWLQGDFYEEESML